MKNSVLMLLCLFMTFTSMASDPQKLGNDIPLYPPIPIPQPRQVVDCNIEAFYVDGTITFRFLEDLGEADIVVTNLTTGDAWSESVEGMGNTSIMLSDDAGYYTITIHTDAGDYYGEFSL